MKKYLLFFCITSLLFSHSSAQNVTVLPSGISPAMSGTYPRLSYDAILALPSPQSGDIAFDTTFLCLRVYNGSKWVCTYQNPTDPSPNMVAIASAGGTSADRGRGIAVDVGGNVYISGIFEGTAAFGITSITSAGLTDIFVAKYSSIGALLWVQRVGGTSFDYINSFAVDASGNVYITGSFTGSVTFGVNPIASAGESDILVAKYNTQGALQWVQRAGGIGNDSGYGIAVDNSGNVYICGYFQGTVLFGSNLITSAGSTDIFVLKFNAVGVLEWGQTVGGTGYDIAKDIELDVNGNVYISGSFSGSVTFGVNSITSAGYQDIFVAKFDPIGSAWTWVQKAGGINNDDYTSGIAIDVSGNVYISGDFRETSNFSGILKTSIGGSDIFVAKYRNDGLFEWVQTSGGISNDYTNGIAVDAAGNVYISGAFEGTAAFGITSITSFGENDIFVAKYSNVANLQWVQRVGGTSYDRADGISVPAIGNVYITGYFSDKVIFGANSKTSAGNYDIFVARLQE